MLSVTRPFVPKFQMVRGNIIYDGDIVQEHKIFQYKLQFVPKLDLNLQYIIAIKYIKEQFNAVNESPDIFVQIDLIRTLLCYLYVNPIHHYHPRFNTVLINKLGMIYPRLPNLSNFYHQMLFNRSVVRQHRL